MAAKTNQQKQKRPELKKVSPHFLFLAPRKFRAVKKTHHLTILVVFTRNMRMFHQGGLTTHDCNAFHRSSAACFVRG